jgi:hypothetical protein
VLCHQNNPSFLHGAEAIEYAPSIPHPVFYYSLPKPKIPKIAQVLTKRSGKENNFWSEDLGTELSGVDFQQPTPMPEGSFTMKITGTSTKSVLDPRSLC